MNQRITEVQRRAAIERNRQMAEGYFEGRPASPYVPPESGRQVGDVRISDSAYQLRNFLMATSTFEGLVSETPRREMTDEQLAVAMYPRRPWRAESVTRAIAELEAAGLLTVETEGDTRRLTDTQKSKLLAAGL